MSTGATWKSNSRQARIARWQAFWALEDLPRPLWFVPADAMLALPLEYARRRQPLDPLFRSAETQYRETRRFNRFYARMQRLLYHDDYIPRFQPQLGIGVFASAFGCPVAFPPDQYPMTHSLIKAGERAAAFMIWRRPRSMPASWATSWRMPRSLTTGCGGRCPSPSPTCRAPSIPPTSSGIRAILWWP